MSIAICGMMMNRVVIGLGTGRCGTVSLAHLLDFQTGVSVTHEERPLLPWKVDLGRLSTRMQMFDRQEGVLVGDVAFSWLNYVPYLMGCYINHRDKIRFICLFRNKDETIRSYKRKLSRRNVNHWMIGRGLPDPVWDDCYPKYTGFASMSQAINRYWEEYYTVACRFMKAWPGQFRIYGMWELNDSARVADMLTFAGVPPDDQVPIAGVRLNESHVEGGSDGSPRNTPASARLRHGKRKNTA